MARFAGVRLDPDGYHIKIRPEKPAPTGGDIYSQDEKVASWTSENGRSQWVFVGNAWTGIIKESGCDDERYEIHRVV